VQHEGRQGIPAHRGIGFLHHSGTAFGTRRFLELFGGTCRLSQAIANLGWQAESFEVDRDPSENVFSHANDRSIRSRIATKEFFAIWMGLTCGSWSRARRAGPDQKGLPPPLRGDSLSEIWGLPNLSFADQQRVNLGNKTAIWCAQIFLLAADCGVPVIIENPLNSRLWICPPFVKLCQRFPQYVYDQCQYGLPWKKPTRLLCANVNLSPAMRTCTSAGSSRCSATGLPHVALKGIQDGVFKTASASPYPLSLCGAIASILTCHRLARME
jgi:hypothetical protein